jgi:two-component system sensor histidine kinase UhpB
MSLRTRVVALIGLVLAAGVLLGSAFAGFEARHALKAELASGLNGGARTVASAFEDLPNSDHPERDLRQLVATFDGNRHVRAVLTRPGSRIALVSHMAAQPHPAPAWFARLLGPPPPPLVLRVPGKVAGYEAIRLEPAAGPDVSIVWTEFSTVVLTLSGTAAAGLALVYLAIGAALRPLRELSAAFARIGAGDYSGRAPLAGPSELTGLSESFNRMAGQLAAMDRHNRTLEAQLLTLQEEERADLARDLHDEIGPHLFAVNVDAEVISQMAIEGRSTEIPAQVRVIQAGIGRMQRLVREILQRLRPARATELGLKAALDDLIEAWRGRLPDVRLELTADLDEDQLTEAQKDTLYRIAQEAVSNAIRHAQPSRVTVLLAATGEEVTVQIEDDGRQRPPPSELGFGIVGMRERVRAQNGTLRIDKRDEGWRVRAELPLGISTATSRTASP